MVDIATIGTSVLLSLTGSFLLTEYKLRRQQSIEESAELDEWYADAGRYASEVERTWNRQYENAQSPDRKGIKQQMALFEKQISRHTSTGEYLDADEDAIELLDGLADACNELSGVYLTNHASPFREAGEDCVAAAEDVEEYLENRG